MSLKPEYFCSNCHEKQPKIGSTLKCCTRCGLVKYCNKSCQKNDFADHKEICLKMAKYLKCAETLEDIPEEFEHPMAYAIPPMIEQYAGYAANYALGTTCWKYAECNSSYLAYEKARDAFEKILDPPWSDNDTTYCAFEFLTFIHLNLGDIKGVNRIIEHWTKNILTHRDNKKPNLTITAAKLGLEMNKLNKIKVAIELSKYFEETTNAKRRKLDLMETFDETDLDICLDKCLEYFKILYEEKNFQTILNAKTSGVTADKIGLLAPACGILDESIILLKVSFGFFSRHPELPILMEAHQNNCRN